MTDPKGHWQSLSLELDAWGDAGLTAMLWLRDDDAVAPGPKLDRLTKLSADAEVPLGLAVIPKTAQETLSRSFAGEVVVLQHGWQHTNHAPTGQKKAELGDHRAADTVLGELRDGAERLDDLFPDHFFPALVPPWNRIGEQVADGLNSAGFVGVSLYRDKGDFAPGLTRVDTHLDPINWRGGRDFVGEGPILNDFIGYLQHQRQQGRAKPIGFLSHHMDLDEAGWLFLAELCAFSHSALRWASPKELF